MIKGIFITATGTDIGKTFVTALIVKKLRQAGISAGYYKAALSGAERKNDLLIPGDADYVNRVAKISAPLDSLVSYVYEHAVSPHLAAQLEGNPVEISRITDAYKAACNNYDYITVEGSGGIVCPIRWDDKRIMLTDIIKMLGLDVLVVASAALGTINSVVLTVEYARKQGINVRGIMLNQWHGGVMEEDNKVMIEQLTKLPVLACIEENMAELPIECDDLLELYE